MVLQHPLLLHERRVVIEVHLVLAWQPARQQAGARGERARGRSFGDAHLRPRPSGRAHCALPELDDDDAVSSPAVGVLRQRAPRAFSARPARLVFGISICYAMRLRATGTGEPPIRIERASCRRSLLFASGANLDVRGAVRGGRARVARTGRLGRGAGWGGCNNARESGGLGSPSAAGPRNKKASRVPNPVPLPTFVYKCALFTKVDYTRAFHADVTRKLEGMIGKTAFSPVRPHISASVDSLGLYFNRTHNTQNLLFF